MADLSCGLKCCKYLLFAFNLILFLIGIALLAVGIFVAVDAKKLFSMFEGVDLGAASSIDLESLLKNSAYVIIAFGAFIFLVAFLGCCGAIKESKCMLATYASIVLIVVIVELVAVILAAVFWGHVKKELKAFLDKSIVDKYDGFNGDKMPTDAESLFWDTAMIEFECCGVKSYKDFIKATKWKKEIAGSSDEAKIPPSCCKMKDKSKFPNVELEDKNCPKNPTEKNAYMKDDGTDGCYEKVKEKISKYAIPIIGVCSAVAVLQLFVIIAGFCLCRRIGAPDDVKA